MSSMKSRPSPLSSQSFTRYEPATSSTSPAASIRSRASTIASPTLDRRPAQDEQQDIFDKPVKEDDADDDQVSLRLENPPTCLPDQFDELPVELISLTDRFVESLSSKAFAEPPTIDQISQLFQEFYARASSNISIHIASLRLKLNRDGSPNTSTPARPKGLAIRQSSDSLRAPTSVGSQQMLTASEVAERRKQRRLLDYKKLLLEEAIERRACEMIYNKLWRHKSTLDEVQDEKLRSKTAALALVGIGLKDLGVEPGNKTDQTLEDLQEALGPARDGLIRMNDEHYPLGKLQHLTAAHKVIVDTLYTMHGSSSSADEILPTLIYTLISAPVEGINIISNLNFIQRFRANTKIDGEAAYCMTNLEAAIGFLENVDLASLRADEVPEGPGRSTSGQQTPSIEKTEPFPPLQTTPAVSTSSLSTEPAAARKPSASKEKPFKTAANAKPLPSPRHQRTLSDLLRPMHDANEAVRATAKEGLDNISNTLDNSLKFFFGRLREQAADPSRSDDLTVPKTLDEARQLVSKPSTPVLQDDGTAISETSSVAGDHPNDAVDAAERAKGKIADDKMLGLFGGRRATAGVARDSSTDRASLRSVSSSARVSFSIPDPNPAKSASVPAPAANPLDAVKNFGGSLNPLGHVGNAFNAFGGTLKGFGRPQPPTQPQPQSQLSNNLKRESNRSSSKSATPPPVQMDTEPQIAIFMDEPAKISAKIRSVPPPIKKFIDTATAADLQIKDIDRLLEDYKRLASLLNQLASQDVDSLGTT